jgi:hypothetical protein
MQVVARLCVPLFVVALSACRGDSAPEVVQDAGGVAAPAIPSTPPDSGTFLAAQRTLVAFLDASREATLDPAALDTLAACGDGGQPYFPTTILAGYSLLPFEFRGDTIIARAEVVTVAEQDIDRRATDRFVARQRLRTDVLEWDVFADESGRWVVCNGLRFGYRGVDSLTTWRPDGASYESAMRQADSIAGARR